MGWQRVYCILPLLILVGRFDIVRASRDYDEKDALVKLGDTNDDDRAVCLENTNNFDLLPGLGSPPSSFPSVYLVYENS